MGIRKKGRRKLVYDNKTYIWYVESDSESPYHILNVISQDKQFIIACPLKTKTPYIISKGKLFQNHRTDGCWNRYCLPMDVPESITPKFVVDLISWAAMGSDAIAIDWDGRDILV